MCDYSIRLNWEGRGKKKAAESDAPGQINFSAGMTSAGPVRPSSDDSQGVAVAPQKQFQDMPFGMKQDEGVTGFQSPSRQDSTFENKHAEQQHEPSMVLSSRSPPYDMSMIDPALMASIVSPGGMYTDNIFGGIHGRSEPQYMQSYERYHSSTPSTPTSVHNPAVPRHRRGRTLEDASLIAEPSSGNRANNVLTRDGTATTASGGSPHPQSIFETPSSNGDTQQQEAVGFDRPPKRARYPAGHDANSLSPHDSTMPPPHTTSYPIYSVDSQTPSAILFDSSSGGTPVTPSSSHGDDTSKDGHKRYSITLSSNTVSVPPDVRRLSVNSLLSGPPGISYQGDQTYDGEVQGVRDWTQEPQDESDDITIYGIDRGFKDLDIGKNDDANAITGVSPRTIRDHLNHSLDENFELMPIEFGFGMNENPAFESGAYYDKPVHVSIPRALEPLPSKLLENPMNLLVNLK